MPNSAFAAIDSRLEADRRQRPGSFAQMPRDGNDHLVGLRAPRRMRDSGFAQAFEDGRKHTVAAGFVQRADVRHGLRRE